MHTRRKHKAGTKRITALENKVDQLMSQLSHLKGHNKPTDDDDPFASTSDSTHDADLDSAGIDLLLDAANEPSHSVDPPIGSIVEGELSIVDRGLLGKAEAAALVDMFRANHVPKFPFVVLSHDETATRLRTREPFLFLCVAAVAMGSAHPLRKIIADEVMRHVTMRIVARSERSLELLRGLLIYTAWYSYPAQKNYPQLNLFVQICVSIMHDLHLHAKQTLKDDECRAVLGTYWLSAGPVVLNHNARVDACLESLAASTDHISDQWIPPFISLQSLLVRIHTSYDLLRGSTGGAVFVELTRGSLKRQLDRVKEEMEEHLANCPSSTGLFLALFWSLSGANWKFDRSKVSAIQADIKHVEARLEEPSLRQDLWTDPEQQDGPLRTTMLLKLIQQSKNLIDAVSALPTSEIAQMTVSTSARLCAALGYLPRAVVTLIQLIVGSEPSSLSGPAQIDDARRNEAQAIYDAADYPNLVYKLAKALEAALEGMADTDKEMDILGNLCSKMRLLARCYPYQVRGIVEVGLLQGGAPRQEPQGATASIDVTVGKADHAQPDINSHHNFWSSFSYEGLDDDAFRLSDEQWASLLGDSGSFN
ncbi:LOW QUALITY PROTEIN: Transcription factor himD [Paramyrothecium foliicola]|nr:LOW QUALITY PROTEIN: Transcription factor himD [Paramyrothecium foliicola]